MKPGNEQESGSRSRIPDNLGILSYADAWNNIAQDPSHAFELVDESTDENALATHGSSVAPYFIEGLDINSEDVVLEIGCGVARLGKPIAPHAGEWWGLDVSRRMVEIAAERCRDLDNVRFFVGTGADLSGVPDESVDKMYCHAVFIHMDKEDFYSYLVDARRVLKPGGLFYFDVWNLCHPIGWLRWQVERSLYEDRASRPIHRNQFSSPDEVRTMLKMSQWEVVSFAETFSVQPVVTKVPPGDDHHDRLQAVIQRYGRCAQKLRYGEGDFRYFGNKLASILRERGWEPEVEVPPAEE